MADSTEGYTDAQYLGLIVPALIALVAGLIIHLFIIVVNVNDWWKGRSVTPVDLIVTSLGISRMCAQCVQTLCLFVVTIFLSSVDSTLAIFYAAYDFFMYVNIWLTSLLSIVFCLKICNLHTRLFLYLRRMIVHRTVYFIVASVLLSTFDFIIFPWTAFNEDIIAGTYNRTTDILFFNCMDIHFIFSYSMVDFFPLLFCYISSVLLFTSLYNHTTKMKMSSNLTINLETYYSAMKFVSFTFIYNTLFFVGHFVCDLFDYFYCVHLEWLHTVLDFLPVLHSSYLIYRIAKLRKQMSKILQNVNDFLFQMSGTKSRENIQSVAQ